MKTEHVVYIYIYVHILKSNIIIGRKGRFLGNRLIGLYWFYCFTLLSSKVICLLSRHETICYSNFLYDMCYLNTMDREMGSLKCVLRRTVVTLCSYACCNFSLVRPLCSKKSSYKQIMAFVFSVICWRRVLCCSHLTSHILRGYI